MNITKLISKLAKQNQNQNFQNVYSFYDWLKANVDSNTIVEWTCQSSSSGDWDGVIMRKVRKTWTIYIFSQEQGFGSSGFDCYLDSEPYSEIEDTNGDSPAADVLSIVFDSFDSFDES